MLRSTADALGPTALQRHVAFAFLVLLSCLALASCQRDPYTQLQDHLKRGDAYLDQKKYPEAILEYRLAISIADVSSIAHYNLAETYVKNDQLLKAFPEYLKASDLAPDRDDLQIKVGNLLLIAGRFADARSRARAVLQRNPKSVPAIILLGNAVVGLKDFASAAELGRKSFDLDPYRAG